jgi:hypothetical protein
MKKPKRSGAGAKPTHLLDTSTLLWALGSPERLSPRARRRVEAGENIVSVANYWEVVIKTQKGLLTIADVATWWRRATELLAARAADPRESCDGVGRASDGSQGPVRQNSDRAGDR